MRNAKEFKPKAETKKAAPQALITRMSDVEPQKVAWLWHPYIPLGKITLLEGDPGFGKTFLMLAIAAAITRGYPLLSQAGAPGEELAPADVLYLSAEDGVADTLRPRLDAADADMSRVHVLTGFQVGEGDKAVTNAVSLKDIPILKQALELVKPKLVVIDPLQAYLGANVDMHRANEVRPLLSALGNLAEEYVCAVVCIRHLSKALGGKAMYAGLGSIDFAAAARSVLQVGEHEDRRLLAHVKSSLAPQGKSIEYELRDGSLFWLGVSDATAEDLRSLPQKEKSENSLESAVTFLQNFLADGPQPANAILKVAKQEDISERTLNRAKKQLDVRSERASTGNGGEGKWLWSLPASILATLRENPATDIDSASVSSVLSNTLATMPSVPKESLTSLPEVCQVHKNSQESKDANAIPLKMDVPVEEF